MRVDIGNALADVATPGVPREALDRLDDRVAAAHDRIQLGRENDEHGYAALNQPDNVDVDAIERAVEPFEDCDTIINVGIGGSALGAATISAALDSDVEAYYLDNVDPKWVADHVESIDLSTTVLNVVSKSGTTA
ncbi:MAG: glucose-6-phosphate isomerase, partial [Halorhabdus sp.]